MLKNFKSIKIKSTTNKKEEEVLAGIKQAVEEMNLVKAGKLKSRPARELLDEL